MLSFSEGSPKELEVLQSDLIGFVIPTWTGLGGPEGGMSSKGLLQLFEQASLLGEKGP